MRKLIFLALAAVATTAAAAVDGAALFQSKCVACHGPKGAGKPAIKGSNLLTDEAKKASDETLAAAIKDGGASKKASHAFGAKGVSPEQVTALVAHIRTLQK
jgi:mono/diheme cytochrome c family protein